ncbi:TlpA family protein disulfide reductase [Alkalicoccus halolimnae]|uniref:Thioredoxin family protein n=1 Tax=Alkalicoccus halolimnae TaxID=1667239 RepID=A0A5C7F0I2_9BACI|nr:thioredoxin family protein [Alkalicoccus halolimnae]TXF82769.1 thioredoxin family protein [Alkalicoccus halolimnae]
MWQQFMENKEVDVVAAAVDIQGASAVKPFVENGTFTCVIDAARTLPIRFQFRTVPAVIFLDKEGIIRWAQEGFSILNPDHYQLLEKLLAGEFPEALPSHQEAVAPEFRSISQQRYKEAMELLHSGAEGAALMLLDEALRYDPYDFIIRKQRWHIRYPEKFTPEIDTAWQRKKLVEERETIMG